MERGELSSDDATTASAAEHIKMAVLWDSGVAISIPRFHDYPRGTTPGGAYWNEPRASNQARAKPPGPSKSHRPFPDTSFLLSAEQPSPRVPKDHTPKP